MLGANITSPWRLVAKSELATTLGAMTTDVVVTFGAGDIDRECMAVCEVLSTKA
jgi:UDP-N-acetylmuramate--alanine ligase